MNVNIKNTIFTTLSVIFLAACGGGGSGGGGDSATPNPTPAPTPAPYTYYKIADEVSDGFVWDSFALAQEIEWYDPRTINGVFSDEWIKKWCNVGFNTSNPFDTTVTAVSYTHLTLPTIYSV